MRVLRVGDQRVPERVDGRRREDEDQRGGAQVAVGSRRSSLRAVVRPPKPPPRMRTFQAMGGGYPRMSLANRSASTLPPEIVTPTRSAGGVDPPGAAARPARTRRSARPRLEPLEQRSAWRRRSPRRSRSTTSSTQPPDDLEGQLAGDRELLAVGDRARHRDAHALARGERAARVVAGLGLDADDPVAGRERRGRGRAAGDQPAAAHAAPAAGRAGRPARAAPAPPCPGRPSRRGSS